MAKHTSTNSCKPLQELLKALKGGRKEMVGLFKGMVRGDAIVVMDARVFPVDDDVDIHSKLLDYFQTEVQTGGSEDVVGWYRTSTIGGFPTKTDISTQMRIQELKNPSFAIVIDGGTTVDILKVRVQAFRTYPEGYTFPAHMNRKRNRTDRSLEVFPHLEKRYPLHVTYFKSSLGNNDAWEIYWNHLISTPKTPGKTIGLEVPGGSFETCVSCHPYVIRLILTAISSNMFSVLCVENKENSGGLVEDNKVRNYVHVKREFTEQYSSPAEAVEGLYVKLVKDVGSSENGSNISSPQKSFFYVTLTQDQATKLADHDCVAGIGALPRKCYLE
ncbi:hypothetical protein KSS87_017603 [Heliosperma pusillum]|nr:hypothetical protein KSS87_017603 [Heliosperma pusillum]